MSEDSKFSIERGSGDMIVANTSMGKMALRNGSDIMVMLEMIAEKAGDTETLKALEAGRRVKRRFKGEIVPPSPFEVDWIEKNCGKLPCSDVCGRAGLLPGAMEKWRKHY